MVPAWLGKRSTAPHRAKSNSNNVSARNTPNNRDGIRHNHSDKHSGMARNSQIG
jgi:hypothetical protein